MTYIDRSAEARDRAVRRSRAARTTLVATAALASVGLAGAIGAGAANAQSTNTNSQGTRSQGSNTSPQRTTGDDGATLTTHRAARLQGHLKNNGSQQGVTTGSNGPTHAKSSGS